MKFWGALEEHVLGTRKVVLDVVERADESFGMEYSRS